MFAQLKRLGSQSIIYTAGDMLNRSFALILIPLYTAYLTPADYGILSITSTIGAVFAILSMQSLETALTRFHYDHPEESSRRRYHGMVWLLMVMSALAFALLVGTVGQPLLAWLFPDVPYIPYIRIVVWTTFATNISFLLLRALLRVQEKPTTYSILNIVVFLVNTGFVIYFVVGEQAGALGNLQGRLLAAVLLAIPIIVVYFRSARLHWSTQEAKTTMAFAVPLLPHLLSLWVLNVSDRVVLQRFVPLADVGIYSLGYQIASILQLLAFSASNAWSPFFFKTADQPGAPRMLSRFSSYYILILIFLGTGIAALAQDALLVMASKAVYYPAYRVVPWVIMGFVMRGFYFLFVTALYYKKQVRALPLVTIGAGVLNVVLNVLTVPKFGYMAAAVNTFIAYGVQAVVMYPLAQRAFRIPYEILRFAKMAVVGIGLFLVASQLPPFHPWLAIAIKTAWVCTFPLWLTLLRFWTPDEKVAIRRLVRRWLDSRRQGRLPRL
jgi:O-antigen/teichoic acid export membrane protein